MKETIVNAFNKEKLAKLFKAEMPAVPITESTVNVTKKTSRRFFRGSVRISMGRFWTDKNYKKYRDRILNTPLP